MVGERDGVKWFGGMVGCPEVIWISLCAAGKRIKKYERLCLIIYVSWPFSREMV